MADNGIEGETQDLLLFFDVVGHKSCCRNWSNKVHLQCLLTLLYEPLINS